MDPLTLPVGPTLAPRPSPAASDPLVVFVTAVILLCVAALIVSRARDGRERTIRLLFIYLTYALIEVGVKRVAHFTWSLYPIKFALFFALLLSWQNWRAGRRMPLRNIPFSGLLAGYLAVAAVQVFNPYQANPIVGILGWLTDFMYAVLYFVAFDLFDGVEPMRRLLRLMAVLGIVSAVVCFAEQWQGPQEMAIRYPMYVQLVHFMADGSIVYRPSALSPYSEIFGVAAMLGLFAGRQQRFVWLFAGIALCLVASILHAVRIVWMTGIAIFALWTLLNRSRRIVSVALVAASVALAVNVGMTVSEGALERSLRSVTTPLDTFQSTRLPGLIGLPTMVATFPFGVGVGAGSPGLRFIDAADVTNFDTHNYLTELAGQMSILGPLLLLAFTMRVLVVGGRSMWNAEPDEWRAQVSISLAVIGALVASFFGGGGLGAYPVTDYFWLLCGATAALTHARQVQLRSVASLVPRRRLLTRVSV